MISKSGTLDWERRAPSRLERNIYCQLAGAVLGGPINMKSGQISLLRETELGH